MENDYNKPCPFCGSVKLTVNEYRNKYNDNKYYAYSCRKCGAHTRDSLTEEYARELWNKRVGDPNEINPCPCCGSNNVRSFIRPTDRPLGLPELRVSVGCSHCGYESGVLIKNRDLSEVTEAIKQVTRVWNRDIESSQEECERK